MPVLNPSSVQEILDLGLHGWAMSRYSGCWVGFKCVAETVESSASVYVDPSRVDIVVPEDFPLPRRRRLDPLARRASSPPRRGCRTTRSTRRCTTPREPAEPHRHRLAGGAPRLGIITSGKCYLDVRQALDDLGISEREAAEARHPRVQGRDAVAAGARGRAPVRRRAGGDPGGRGEAPDRRGPAQGAALQLARRRAPARGRQVRREGRVGAPARRLAAARRRRAHAGDDRARDRAAHRAAGPASRTMRGHAARASTGSTPRKPRWRSPRSASRACPTSARAARTTPRPGCPRAAARRPASAATSWRSGWTARTPTFTQMGGEGVPWIGQAPFTEEQAHVPEPRRRHLLPLRHPGDPRRGGRRSVNITYKILYNDAVAMTGGQPVDGPLSPADIARQCAARACKDRRGQRRPGQVPGGLLRPARSTMHHRDELDAVQRELREIAGTHGPDLRPDLRGREAPPPQARQVSRIRRSACSSTSWCAKAAATAACKSNCVSVAPMETEFGRKRTIDQSSCNKDYLLRQGLLPQLRHGRGRPAAQAEAGRGRRLLRRLPEPALAAPRQPYGILVTGIGGTGVVTIGALLGMAAHLEGKGCIGARHDRARAEERRGRLACAHRATRRSDIHATRIAAGEADCCSAATSSSASARAAGQDAEGRHKALVNTALVMPARLHPRSGRRLPAGLDGAGIEEAVGAGRRRVHRCHPARHGAAGRCDRDQPVHGRLRVPARPAAAVGEAAIERAIELNGVAIESNKQAFQWGRLAAVDPARGRAAAAIAQRRSRDRNGCRQTLDEIIARRVAFLTDYQDAA